MKKTYLIYLAAILPFCSFSHAVEHIVKSPDGEAVVAINVSESTLTYEFEWQGKQQLEPSVLTLFDKAQYEVLGAATKTIDETWKPTWGQFSEVRDHCQQLTLQLKASGKRVDLICQVYDDGLGLRFVVPAQVGLNKQAIRYTIECQVAEGYTAYWGHPSSRIPGGPVSSTELAKGNARIDGMPFIMNTQSGAWLALLESDLFSADLFRTGKLEMQKNSATVQMVAGATATDEGALTPWRVILFGEQAGDLVTNHVALNLAAPCQIEDTSWIKPGIGIWDWRVHGYDNGDFVYGINTQSFFRYIDFCAAQGIPYFTIDDFWFLKAGDGKMEVSPEVDIEKVMAYAKEKGVGIMLYYDRHKGDFGDDKLFEHYADLGAVGMKYGFMGNNANFTRNAIRSAADNKLMVFFHDSPVPMVGVERTMPNMISREYGHGQQDARSAFLPSTFVKMAMVNALTGPLDISNGNFGLDGINAGEREKGPKKKHSYISTVVSEVARCVIIPSALVTLPDAPEEYLKKADLFGYLKMMPATWDETRVIDGQIGDYISIARRSGDTWFVGSVNSEGEARTLEIPLDFLKAGVSYQAVLYQDGAETNAKSNHDVYEVLRKTVTSSDVIEAPMVLGGGHAMILQPR